MGLIPFTIAPYAKAPGTPIDKVNYVIDRWSNPCSAPWQVYAETLLPAALILVIGIFQWDASDQVRGKFNPKTGGRSRGRFKAISQHLPTVTDAGAQKFFWSLANLSQRGLFYWMLVDLTLDLAVNFTTLIYATEYCTGGTLGQLTRTGGAQSALVSGDDGRPLVCSTLVENTGGWSTTPTTHSIPPGTYSIAVHCDAERAYGDKPYTLEAYAEITQTGAPSQKVKSGYRPASSGKATGLVGFGRIEVTTGPATVVTHWRSKGSGTYEVKVNNASVSITREA